MIIDTTYLLPLSAVGVDTDLLKAIDDGRINLELSKLAISSISLFELQAKTAKLGVSTNLTNEAIDVITSMFRVEPFYDKEVVDIGFELLKHIPDYIDCIIAATAIAVGEGLITEDTKIIDKKHFLRERYKLNIASYKELIKR